MGELRLKVKAYQNQTQWDWELSGPDEEILAGHQVKLDPRRWEFGAVSALPAYLWSHAAPDRRLEDETRIVAEVGDWIGEQVLGPIAHALLAARPATVRVVIPGEAAAMLGWPLQLARVNGIPVALQDVTFVMAPSSADAGRETTVVGERLRVLGLFSLPAGETPLNLRQERWSSCSLRWPLSACRLMCVSCSTASPGHGLPRYSPNRKAGISFTSLVMARRVSCCWRWTTAHRTRLLALSWRDYWPLPAGG